MKDLRKNRKHAIKNALLKTHVKALTHQLVSLVTDGKKKEAEAVSRSLQQALDKAAKNNIFHSNKANRKKSQAIKKLAVKK